MGKGIKAARITVCILCVLLSLTAIITGIILGILSNSVIPQSTYAALDDLPDMLGDEAAYVSDCFYVENNLERPAVAKVTSSKPKWMPSYNVGDSELYGRGQNLIYYIEAFRFDEIQAVNVGIGCMTNNENFKEFKNAKTYGNYRYEEEFYEIKDSPAIRYTIKVKNNKLSKDCEMYLSITSLFQDVDTQQFQQYGQELLHSFIDNIVFRNV